MTDKAHSNETDPRNIPEGKDDLVPSYLAWLISVLLTDACDEGEKAWMKARMVAKQVFGDEFRGLLEQNELDKDAGRIFVQHDADGPVFCISVNRISD